MASRSSALSSARLRRWPLHALLQPLAPCLVGDAEVLDAERAAVRLLERGHQLAQRAPLAPAELLPRDDLVEIRLGEAELLQAEQGVGPRAVAERIEIARSPAG